ncbi:SRPBCC family protein [Aeromicrobium sp. CF4.19]|uniref:SRPBCC family protein n=1 Tax=Aeromicrobium sp. CF4.19 TaxID=3373082 RepID=UPI003EE62BFD
MDSDTVSVERVIRAEPEEIFALLADAGRHESFDGSGTVQGTSAPSRPLELGSVFGMSMKMGLPYSTKNTVIELEPGRRIAWQTKGFGGVVGGRIWRYELEPQPEGSTLVRETWDLSQDKQAFLLKRSSMPATTEKNMRRTLDRLAEAVEA